MARVPLILLLALTPLVAGFLGGPSVEVPGLGELTGKYASLFSHEVAMFLGIPYGKPPVGDLRWMPPQPYGAWSSPRDASKYASGCIGSYAGVGGPGTSEDCLFLNVFGQASKIGGAANLPVMVWIYGGTFDTGDSNQFTPEGIVSTAGQPVVVVSLNYRINTLGFLGSKALAARSLDGSTGNYGLQDQRLAFTWVRDHISAFGGRGDDVTIFGESAGGNSVLHHIVQPASFGLYRKAIIESGTYDAGYGLHDAELLCDAIMQKVGCGSNLDCFLNKSATDIELAKDAVALKSNLTELHWGPIVDGVSMVGTPQQLVALGKFNNQVPVLMGTNRDEFSLMINLLNLTDYSPWMTEAQFDHLIAFLGDANVRTVKQLYDPSVYEYPSNLGFFSQWWWMAMRVATDNGIPFRGFSKGVALGHCSARRIADEFLKGGTESVYMYNFARDVLGGQVGHGFELPFVFHMSALLGLGYGNQKLSSAMINYWVNFATTGNPSLPSIEDGIPHWPAYKPDGSNANVRFDATFAAPNITVQYAFRKAACDFWDSVAVANQPIRVPIVV